MTVTAADDLSGVAQVSVTFTLGTVQRTAAATITAPSPSSVTGLTVTMPRYSQAGTWAINALNLVDATGNVTTMTAAQITAAGFPATITIL